jgi:hypothetical protein
MRSVIERRLAAALIVCLLLIGVSAAEPPGPKEELPKRIGPPPGLSVDEVVERIMSFDKNKKGKVTKEDLPERMHHLIALGDTNKDGALDRDEVRKLATSLAAASGPFGVRTNGGGFGGRAEGLNAGFGAIRLDAGPGGPGPGPGLGDIEGVVDDLKLPGKKKDQALAAVKAHRENVRKLMEQARGELLQKMKGILSEEELQDFLAALDRPRGATIIDFGPRDAPRGSERKPDPPQK